MKGRGRRRNIYQSEDLDGITKDYVAVLKHFQATMSVEKSCRCIGIPRITFYRQKHIAELKIIDPEAFRDLYLGQTVVSNLSIKKLDEMCRVKMLQPAYLLIAAQMRRAKKLLPS